MTAALPTAALEALTNALGPKGIVDAPEDMAAYLTEERGLYQGTAALVARPADTAEVAAVVGICAEHGIPITPQGGNTGLVGGGVPAGGIVLATGRMNQIRELDRANHTMTVDAGCILQAIQSAADDAGCLFPLSLAAEGTCQIGGNLATNAGGVGVLRYGNARDLVLGLEAVLPDGRIWNGLRPVRKDNTGYDLKNLLIGAEGTLGIITGAVLKLFPKAKHRTTALLAVDTPAAALDVFQHLRDSVDDAMTAFELIARRGMDFVLQHIEGVRDPINGSYPYYVLVELTSTRETDDLGGLLEAALEPIFEQGHVQDAVVASSEAQSAELWRIRESIPEAQKHEGGSIKHDISVPTSKIPAFIEQGIALLQRELPDIRPVVFGHMGDGNLHFNISQPTGMGKADYLSRWDAFNRIIHDLAHSMGGSFSAEHGIGQLKRGELNRYHDAVEQDAMRAIKAALDPKGIMNPGKVL